MKVTIAWVTAPFLSSYYTFVEHLTEWLCIALAKNGEYNNIKISLEPSLAQTFFK